MKFISIILPLLFLISLAHSQSRLVKSAEIQGEKELETILKIDFGEVDVRSYKGSDLLFKVDVLYDRKKIEPEVMLKRSGTLSTFRYEASNDGMDVDGNDIQRDHLSEIFLNEDVIHELDFSLGAGKADLDLTHLKIRQLDISSGAGSIDIFADSKNPERLNVIKVQTGVGKLDFSGLLNLNFGRLDIEGGVGSINLYFDGESTGDHFVKVKSGVGSIKIRVPEDVGLKIRDNSSFFSNLSYPDRCYKDGNYYLSDNYKTAKTTIEFDITSGIGSVSIRDL